MPSADPENAPSVPSRSRIVASAVPAIAIATIVGQVFAALVAWTLDRTIHPCAVAISVVALGAIAVATGRVRTRIRVIGVSAGSAVAILALIRIGLAPLAALVAV